jgi:hypothetical protein
MHHRALQDTFTSVYALWAEHERQVEALQASLTAERLRQEAALRLQLVLRANARRSAQTQQPR